MSKFVVWIDTPTDNNTITYEELEKLKVNGFVPNNIISSNEVNSIIRQSNLVACALMNLTGNNTLNHRSSVQDVQNVLGSHFATNINNFTMATTRSNIEPSDTLLIQLGKISKYFNDLGSLAYKSEVDTSDFKSTAVSPNAKNVNTTINGKKISDIFEDDGITVKKANNSEISNYATGALETSRFNWNLSNFETIQTDTEGKAYINLEDGIYLIWVGAAYPSSTISAHGTLNFGLIAINNDIAGVTCKGPLIPQINENGTTITNYYNLYYMPVKNTTSFFAVTIINTSNFSVSPYKKIYIHYKKLTN